MYFKIYYGDGFQCWFHEHNSTPATFKHQVGFGFWYGRNLTLIITSASWHYTEARIFATKIDDWLRWNMQGKLST